MPEELDLLITSNSNTLKTYEQVKAYVNEQVALRRDKKVSGPVPMDVDALADKIIAVAQGEGSEGTSNGWTWPEEGCTGAARQGKGPGDGHCATSGTSSLHFADDVTEDAGKLADKLEEIMSFVSNLKGKGKDGKSKGKGKGGKRDVQCWHCGKIGHVAAECWQKDAEMEQYRASKGNGKAKGSSKGEWEDPSKGSWSKSSWKGKGNPWGSRKGTYWFDQTNCSSSDGDRAWAFSVEARTAQDSSEFLNPKISCKPKVWETPPGLSPPVLTSSTWDAFRDSETEFDDEELTMKVDMVNPLKRRKPHMPRSTFISKSQAKKKAKADSMLVDQSIKENEAMMQVSEMLARSENPVMNALCLTTAPCREESVNMVQGWRREEEGWVQVRSVMDSGCGVSVAPPGMCPTYPITESEGSRRGQEFMSASEDTMPNLGEQKLGVVLDNGGETMIKYQIADVSRALNSITEICDAGHPDFGNHVIFGRRGGMVVNLETGKTTHFQRENNIYCLDYWVKPFQRLGS